MFLLFSEKGGVNLKNKNAPHQEVRFYKHYDISIFSFSLNLLIVYILA